LPACRKRRGLGRRSHRLRHQTACGYQGLDLATDHRGTAYGAVDLGHLFGSQKQVGARVNLAGERIQSYVNGADGWRAMGAGAADWKISAEGNPEGDFEYQHKVERSVSGYQLLGGDARSRHEPRIYPSTMLGDFNPGSQAQHL
jgi:iron complex outermembrane receptor protein